MCNILKNITCYKYTDHKGSKMSGYELNVQSSVPGRVNEYSSSALHADYSWGLPSVLSNRYQWPIFENNLLRVRTAQVKLV
jgi:hypothetical protein